MEPRLVRAFDRLIRRKGYPNRSEAIRDLVRDTLVREEWAVGKDETMATVNLVYDHHHGDVTEMLNSIEHAHLSMIVSTLHVNLDHHHCLEVIVLRGTPARIQALADRLISAKGVKHGKLSVETTGKTIV